MKSVNEKTKANLEEYYRSKKEGSENENSRAVGWKDQKAQSDRFEQLVRVINDEAGFSINDLGCGWGDLISFLKTTGFHDFKYYGYDHLTEMIGKATELYASDKDAGFFNIKHSSDIKEADYSVASGIFSLKFEADEYEWLHYILETIHVMNAKSLKGFSFNCLTKYSDLEFMRSELYYADPLFLFDYCKRNFSKNVALLHDYYQYDFTILVRK